jgi:mannose-6-phosphate isomerase-like protein (cupin superfamily)
LFDQETVLEIRKREPENLTRAHGLDLKLLHPWPGLDTPFQGAWCVLRPGDVSAAHAHDQFEIFIGMSGRAEVRRGDRRQEFVAGDLVLMQPGVEHQITNEGGVDFSYYAIWWDRKMSAEFIARNSELGRDEPTLADEAE